MWALGFIFRYQKSILQCPRKSVSRSVWTLLVSPSYRGVYTTKVRGRESVSLSDRTVAAFSPTYIPSIYVYDAYSNSSCTINISLGFIQRYPLTDIYNFRLLYWILYRTKINKVVYELDNVRKICASHS